MEHNLIFETAVEYVNQTSCSIFLTGKAGTGKTTFLKYIKENTTKKCVVVAPTGVAAINAGGVTMHSLFQLPLAPFVPVTKRSTDANVTDRYSLFRDMRVSSEKRELFRDVELVIIDEVSMVRADTLDALDAILRYFRRQPHKVFGGVQMLFIGDLFQLPPVMPDGEWNLLKDYYKSPFFFHSRSIIENPPVYIELKKIYRQSEQRFIHILNRVRNNETTDDDLDVLNARYGVSQENGKKYVTLTSHNYKADRINAEALRKLPGTIFECKGTVEGDFPDKSLPTDITLSLKEGAQVMFIRNDKSNDRRFYNGKLAVVSRINETGVYVEMLDTKQELLLEKETWENVKYSYNPEEERIDEEKLGSFSQFPIRLAWAITIHKSQGLTFEHAIIDAGESFAPGQVYVALSRCVSLDGLILQSRIDRRAISTHEEVLHFALLEKSEEQLMRALEEEKHVYVNNKLLDAFDFYHLNERLIQFISYTASRKFSSAREIATELRRIAGALDSLQQVAVKFQQQLGALLKEKDVEKLKERTTKAIVYFSKELDEKVLTPIEKTIEEVKNEKKIRKYLKEAASVKLDIAKKIITIQDVKLGDVSLNLSNERFSIETITTQAVKVSSKPVKGDSINITLAMYREGKSIDDIAKERGLTKGTIETHFVSLIKDGELNVSDFMSMEKFRRIKDEIIAIDSSSASTLKQRLGDDYSFNEIRVALNSFEKIQK